MIAFGLIYIIASVLALKLAVPDDSVAFFISLGANATRAHVVYGLFSLADFVLMPAIIGLYLALRRHGKTAMLVAAGLLFLFIFMDLSTTEFNTLTLVTLAQHYASSTSDAQRTAYMAAADYALATIPLASFYSWVVGSLGLLIASIIMLKGNFGKRTAYAGMILNTAGIIGGFYVFIPILTLVLTPILILWGIWLILVGSRLYGLRPVASYDVNFTESQ